MDTVQALLIAVVVILTIMLVIIGLQVFYILRELRKTLYKANRVLDSAHGLTENLIQPIASISALISGLKSGTALASLLKKLKENRKELSQGKKI